MQQRFSRASGTARALLPSAKALGYWQLYLRDRKTWATSSRWWPALRCCKAEDHRQRRNLKSLSGSGVSNSA